MDVNRTSPFIKECHTLANCSLKLRTAVHGTGALAAIQQATGRICP